MNIDKDLKAIRASLGHLDMEKTPALWLDTQIPALNSVIGHKRKGIGYGTMMELTGLNSAGKTAIATALAALAQRDGALVIWESLENSFDPGWALQRGFLPCPKCGGDSAKKEGVDCNACGGSMDGKESYTRGLDNDKMILVRPYVGKFEEMVADTYGRAKKKVSASRLSTGQELCAETEAFATAMHKKHKKMVIVVDSIASILTEGEGLAGLENQNMRTNMDLPMFMSKLLRRWVGLIPEINAWTILINQLRNNPKAKPWEDSWVAPGGNAAPFYSHVRVRMWRKGGKLQDKGEVVGIQGVMRCHKNKLGGIEYSTVGYRLNFAGKLEFVDAKDIKKEEE